MMRRFFPLLLVLAFLLGCLGHFLSRTEPVKETPYALSFRAEKINGLLLHSLPNEGARVTVGERTGSILSVKAAPTLLYERRDGVLLSYPSSLLSTLTVTIALDAHEKDGRVYLGEKHLALGDEVCILSDNFSVCARFTGISAPF